MRRLPILLAAGTLPLASCTGFLNPPQTVGDMNAGFRYVAVDPLPVQFKNDFSKCPRTGPVPDLMDALHDLSSRVAVQQISGEGSVKAPGVGAGASGSTFQVTQDFIAYDETPLRFEVTRSVATGGSRGKGGTVSTRPTRLRLMSETEIASEKANPVITVPVYVGIGLRLTANVTIREGNVNLADLGTISAAAKAKHVTGGLVVQTLGVNGPKVTGIIPLPGELNTTTIQNATVAMGAMKVLIHDPATGRWPRVVGIHYPFERIDQAMINAIVAALAEKRLEWKPCQTDEARLQLL